MKRLVYELIESLRIAYAQIRANKTRACLTALGVIIGIVAVTLMGTAIMGINAGVEKSLSGFGDDILYVTKWPWHEIDDWWNFRNRRVIKSYYSDRINDWLVEHPGSALIRSIPTDWKSTTVLRGEYRVDNVFTQGTTSDAALMSKSEMREGRFFSEFESQTGANVCVLGADVADALFPNESALGKWIRVGGQNFRVIGVPARQGSFLGLWSWDTKVTMPIAAYHHFFSTSADSSEVHVQVDKNRMDEARDELRGLMRRLRELPPEQPDDFEINEQNVIRQQLDPIKRGIAIAGLAITGLALFVGAIGIMNITYVSVKERTREIGTRKALGARRRTILLQFLIEAVSISFIGGVIGLILTETLATIVKVSAPNFPIVFSVALVVFALATSVVTGVLSGFAPAWSASKLDPVVALRYE